MNKLSTDRLIILTIMIGTSPKGMLGVAPWEIQHMAEMVEGHIKPRELLSPNGEELLKKYEEIWT